MGFLKKLTKKVKKAVKKVAKTAAKVSPVAKTAKAIKKGKPLAIAKALATPASKVAVVKSAPGLAQLAQGKSVDQALNAGLTAGAAGAAVYFGGQAINSLTPAGGAAVIPNTTGQGGAMGFFDDLGNVASGVGNFASEVGASVGQVRDAWTQFTGGGPVGVQTAPATLPEPTAEPAPSGLPMDKLLLIGGGVLILLLVMKKG